MAYTEVSYISKSSGQSSTDGFSVLGISLVAGMPYEVNVFALTGKKLKTKISFHVRASIGDDEIEIRHGFIDQDKFTVTSDVTVDDVDLFTLYQPLSTT